MALQQEHPRRAECRREEKPRSRSNDYRNQIVLMPQRPTNSPKRPSSPPPAQHHKPVHKEPQKAHLDILLQIRKRPTQRTRKRRMMRLQQRADTLVVEGVGAGRDEERLLNRHAEQACSGTSVSIILTNRRGRDEGVWEGSRDRMYSMTQEKCNGTGI